MMRIEDIAMEQMAEFVAGAMGGHPSMIRSKEKTPQAREVREYFCAMVALYHPTIMQKNIAFFMNKDVTSVRKWTDAGRHKMRRRDHLDFWTKTYRKWTYLQ